VKVKTSPEGEVQQVQFDPLLGLSNLTRLPTNVVISETAFLTLTTRRSTRILPIGADDA